MQPIDLLLLNVTNHPFYCSYPYAFVQVSEIARRHSLRVQCIDLFMIPQEEWLPFLQQRLLSSPPRMIGATLRNLDSLLVSDYLPVEEDHNFHNPRHPSITDRRFSTRYFPPQATRDLIAKIRTLTGAPIVVGGFGFSLLAEQLLGYLRPDFGVCGDPDSFFEHFDNILANTQLELVSNLLYWQGDRVAQTPREHFAPARNREYTDEILGARQGFFASLSSPVPLGARAVPIEVLRGCPHNCVYCSEPQVKGKTIRPRDFLVVADELEFLARHDLSTAWFVCSELDVGGTDWVLGLAETVIRINEKRSAYNRVRWYAYHLSRFSLEELRVLRRSGYQGGCTSVPPLHDNTLQRLQVPVNAAQMAAHLKSVGVLLADERSKGVSEECDRQRRILSGAGNQGILQGDDRLRSRLWSVFLGAPQVTPETLRATLEVVDREGLQQYFELNVSVRATRIFSKSQEECEPFRFDPEGEPDTPEFVNPTYVFPPAVVQQLGSAANVVRFFKLLEVTYLSCNHLFEKRWGWFLRRHTRLEDFHALLQQAAQQYPGKDLGDRTNLPEVALFLEFLLGKPTPEKTNLLFNPPPGRELFLDFIAGLAIPFVLSHQREQLNPLLEYLNLRLNPLGNIANSELEATKAIYRVARSYDDLIEDLERRYSAFPGTLRRFLVEYSLYAKNIVLRPEYAPFFLESDGAALP